MTQLFEKAISEVAKMPEEIQDAIASIILEELRDERKWQEAFSKTSNSQWDRMAEMVRGEILKGDTESLDDFLE
jgi:hypothetical protein